MLLTLELANQIWCYDPETGHFFWKISPKYDVLVGDRAGHFDGLYWRLRYKKKTYKASRVAWLVMTGLWPKHQVDHVNLDKTDDRFINLRDATDSENRMNTPVKVNNKLKTKGVHKHRHNGYRATISLGGKPTHLGCFKTLEAAKAAYDAAATKLFGEFARL